MGSRRSDRLQLECVLVFAVAAVSSIMFLSACESFGREFEALGEEFIPPTPSEAAEWMFDPHNAEKRRKGTTLIANSGFGGAEVYVKVYEDRLDPDHVDSEEDPLVLAALIRALSRHGEPEHAKIVAFYLSNEIQQVRWEAAKGLQRLHNPEVVPLLLDSLRNRIEDKDVRVAVAKALGQYAEDRVFQVLISDRALDARELALNVASRDSLKTLTGEDHGDNPRDWLAWYNQTDEPFDGQQEFYYQTYSRDETLLDVLTFWKSNNWETPRPPAGMRNEDTRKTYPDGDTDNTEKDNDTKG